MITQASNRFRTSIAVGQLLPAYLLLGLLKHFVPLSLLAHWAWSPSASARNREAERRSAAIVVQLSQLLGLPDRDCLQRSLLLYRVLSRAGAEPKLVVGFARMNDRILGHAWVVVDGHAIFEPETELLRFSPAFRYGERGRLFLE